MKAYCSLIKFRIDVDFEGSEVDMVYKEMTARGVTTPVPSLLTDSSKIKIDKQKLIKTPTEATVNFALEWLSGFVDRNEMCIRNSKWDRDYSKRITKHTTDGMAYVTSPDVKTELEEIGVSVESTYGLMMGTCHLICQIDSDKYTPEIVEKSIKIVNDIFKRFVKYHASK